MYWDCTTLLSQDKTSRLLFRRLKKKKYTDCLVRSTQDRLHVMYQFNEQGKYLDSLNSLANVVVPEKKEKTNWNSVTKTISTVKKLLFRFLFELHQKFFEYAILPSVHVVKLVRL